MQYNASLKGKAKVPAQPQPTASTSKEPTKSIKGAGTVPKKPSNEKVKQEPKPEPVIKKEAPKTTLAKKGSTTVQSGGLDWGKAKPKAPPKAAPEKAKPQQKAITAASTREPSVESSTTSDPKPKVCLPFHSYSRLMSMP